MSLLSRFIKVPIKVYDTKEAELMGKPEYEDSFLKLCPFDISNYKPTADKEADNYPCTYVTMKNGDSFFVYLTIEEFEKLLEAF